MNTRLRTDAQTIAIGLTIGVVSTFLAALASWPFHGTVAVVVWFGAAGVAAGVFGVATGLYADRVTAMGHRLLHGPDGHPRRVSKGEVD